MRIGDLQVDAVLDGAGRFQPTRAFRGTTDDQWAPHAGLLGGDGLLGFAMGGFLVRGTDRTVLVDLGVGPRTLLGIEGGAFMESLRRLGVEAGDVTDVVFTHLHLDHVGWASYGDGRPVFPSATYRAAGADWEHFLVEHPGPEADILRPVAARFEMWDGSGPLVPGIDRIEAPGHTPGSTVIVLSSGTERAMLLGDVVHCPVELVDDEWEAMFDVDPDLARRTRIRLNRELEGSDIPVSAAHFDGLAFGRLLRAEGSRRWLFD
ncbi:MAG TPA: MBL fold metallo-hydrolase [Acidimicrobiales bacterium]|nr:MBL fold metallo-hydrolase [Acidimicrobiales bacterium]